MRLTDLYNHAEKLARRTSLWPIICMDGNGVDYVRDEDFELLHEMRADTWDSELRKDLDEVIAWAHAHNERVGA